MAPTRVSRFAFDAELVLRPASAPAVTAAGDAATRFDLTIATAEPIEGRVGSKQEFVAVVHVTSVTEGGTVGLKVSNADGSVSKVFSVTEVTAPGEYVLPITREQIETVAGGAFIGLTHTVEEDGSLDYWGYLAPFYGLGH